MKKKRILLIIFSVLIFILSTSLTFVSATHAWWHFWGEEISLSPQPLGLQAFHRNGQTFLTWSEIGNYFIEDLNFIQYASILSANSAIKYRIYRHTSPITVSNINQAIRIAEVGIGKGYNYYIYGKAGVDAGGTKQTSDVPRFVIQEGAGGWGKNELPLNTGLYVYTTSQGGNGNYYYAITSIDSNGENLNDFSLGNSLQTPVAESYDTNWKPIVQNNPDVDTFRYFTPAAKQQYIFTRWEAEPLNNYNSWPQNYMVAVPFSVNPPYKISMDLHCWGAYWAGCISWDYYPDGIFFSSTDYPPQSWWSGWNDNKAYWLPGGDSCAARTCTGTNKYYTMKRMLSFLNWMKTRWQIDDNRIICSGQSMGGSGGKIFCMKHPEMFSYVNSWVGVGIPSQSPEFATSYEGLFGKVSQGAIDEEGMNTWDNLNMALWMRANPTKETPFISFANGKNDPGIGWAQAVEYYKALRDTKRPFIFNWGQEAHSQRAYDISPNGASGNEGSNRLDFQGNKALPAFTGFSLDNNPGNGDPADGDPTGAINLYQRWDPNTIVDQASHFEMELWMAQAPSSPATTDVTLRNLQTLSTSPGQSFSWQLKEGATIIQEGTGNADSVGLVTISQISLVNSVKRRLIVDMGAGGTICGNGVIEGIEQCDDGNFNNNDACTNSCKDARCGDGIIRTGFEVCDDGALNGQPGKCNLQCNAITLGVAITSPTNNQVITSSSVTVKYSESGDLAGAGVDHVHLQLDSGTEIRDLENDGVHVFNNVADGAHSIKVYMADVNHVQIGNAATVSFTVDIGGSVCSISDPALVLNSPFDDGTAKDLSASAHNSVVTGATAIANGKYGGAFNFDGVNDYITVNDGDNLDFELANEDFSVFAWVRTTTPADGDVIFQKMDTLGDGWRLILMGSGVVRAYINGILAVSSAGVSDGQWHHVGFVAKRDGNLRVYIDGVASGTGVSIAGQTMNIALQTSRIGAASYFVETLFSGDIDEVLIYNRALSSTEISALANGDFCSKPCGNGIPETGEACDDGNTVNGDGCSAVCTVEQGWICNGQPSICVTCVDNDGDSWNSVAGGMCGTLADCNDRNANVNPGVSESCGDGIDNNCARGIDEDCVRSSFCPTLPPASGNIIAVNPSQASSLDTIVSGAVTGTTILLQDGTYAIDGNLYFSTAGVTLRSQSGNRDAVILDGRYLIGEIVYIDAVDITIADLTIMRAAYHDIHIVTGGDRFNLYNLKLLDASEQFIKANPTTPGITIDDGTLACSHIELTENGRTRVANIPGTSDCYTGGLDAHNAKGWIIRDNLIRSIYCNGRVNLAEHGIHLWNGGINNLVERNIIIDNSRGIGFGLLVGGTSGGTIRNNFIYANIPSYDSGIGIENSPNSLVYHNTIYSSQGGFNVPIDLRGTVVDNSVVVRNNLHEPAISVRNGATPIMSNNVLASSGMFVNLGAGNLHLLPSASGAINRGMDVGVGSDIDGNVRDAQPDVGADEFVAGSGPVCGNGIPETGEACDDGNTVNGDGCSASCTVEISPCVLTNAYWSKTNAVQDENVNLIVEGTNCDGKNINFAVHEDDNILDGDAKINPVSVAFSGGTAAGTWKAEWECDGEDPVFGICWGGNPEYYFAASLQEDNTNKISSLGRTSGILQTTAVIATCGNLIPETGEECDDGNTIGGDGCSAICKNEVTPVCDGSNPEYPRCLPLLYSQDLTYEGAFKVPSVCGGTGQATFAYGGNALAYRADRNTLFMVGHVYDNNVAEISIPQVTNTNNLNNLQTATVLQSCTDATEGHKKELISSGADPGTIVAGGNLVFENNLYGTFYMFYDAGGLQDKSHFRSGLDLSVLGDFQGMYTIGNTPQAGFVSGYMGHIPAEWQSLFGGPALTGNCCLSIIGRTSLGPSAFVFNPNDLGVQNPVPSTPLVYYSLSHPTLGAWGEPDANPVYSASTGIRGVVFPEGTRSVLFFGRHGAGKYCYGCGCSTGTIDNPSCPITAECPEQCYDPVASDKGQHNYPYIYQVWAYDALDLLDVKNGIKQPWEVTPYSYWNFDLPFTANGRAHNIGGAVYDSANKRILFSETCTVTGCLPVVHSFKVDTIVTPSVCGNGIVETGEQCDDGNTIGGDGCSATCKNEIIGSTPDLLLTSPEAREYKNTLVPLEFIASNADGCYYVLDGVRKDSACNVNEVLNLRPAALNVPENHRIDIFAVNVNGQTTKGVDFSVVYTRSKGIRYDKFRGKGETTNLDDFSDLELGDIDLVLDDGVNGKIKFNEKLNLALEADLVTNIVDLDSNVNIEHKKIEIKSDILKGLNKKATLTFRNVGFNDPKTQKDGADCSAVDCVEVSYTDGIYVVDVSGFSVYIVVEGQQQPPPPSDGGSPGNNGGSDGGGFVTPPKDVKKNESGDGGIVDIIVINGTGEELERVELNLEETQNVNVGEGTRIVLEVEGSGKGEVVDFSVEEDRVVMRVVKDDKEYEILGNEVVQLLLGDKEVYFGVRDIGQGRAIVTLGLEKESVEKEIGIVKPRWISYILIGIVAMLVLVVAGLMYKYLKFGRD